MSIKKGNKKFIKINNNATSIITEAEKSLVKKAEYQSLYSVLNIKDLNIRLRNMYSAARTKYKKGLTNSRNWFALSTYRTKVLKISVISALIIANVLFLLSGLCIRYKVYMNDQYLGVLNNKQEMAAVLEQVSKELLDKNKKKISFNNTPVFKPIIVFKSKKVDNNEIIKNIENKGLYELAQKPSDNMAEEQKKEKRETRRYKVQKGDTLWVIAQSNGSTVDRIIELNPGLTENIKEGQEILLDTADTVLNTKEKKIPALRNNRKVGIKKTSLKRSTGTFVRPIYGAITSRFGYRWGRTHKGIDIRGSIGEPIYAADGGRVEFAGRDGGYGKLIIIRHTNGYATYYGHCSRIFVREGTRVSKRQIIGRIGMTGTTTGPHLHFEIRKNGIPQNPSKYI